eukprot:jgi/Tetstr1/455778/TSEL_042575.t1
MARRRFSTARWLAVGAALWLGALFVLQQLMEGLHRGRDAGGADEGAAAGTAGQAGRPALEVGSTMTSSGGDALLPGLLAASLDEAGRQVFALERARLSSDMRREMEAEALKVKDKATGEVRKLSRKRVLTPEEVEGFHLRRNAELTRLGKQLAAESCGSVDACVASTVAALRAAVAGDGVAFATASALGFASEAEGRRTFGSNLANVSLLAPWLPADTSRYRYESCAVVGNSGILSGSGFGKAVDAHDAVLRVNQAPTRGYEADVGRGTTLRVLNSVWGQGYLGGAHEKRLVAQLERNVALVATRISPANLAQLAAKLAEQRGDVSVLLLANGLVSDARRALDKFRLQTARIGVLQAMAAGREGAGGAGYKGGLAPSTGLLAVMLALRACSSVTVYGFSHEISRDASSSSYPYHYFSNYIDSAELRAHPHHSFKMEGDLLATFHREGLLRLCEKPGCVVSASASVLGRSAKLGGLLPGKSPKEGKPGSKPGGGASAPAAHGLRHGAQAAAATAQSVAAAKARATEAASRGHAAGRAGPLAATGAGAVGSPRGGSGANSNAGGGGGTKKKRKGEGKPPTVDTTTAKKERFMRSGASLGADGTVAVAAGGGGGPAEPAPEARSWAELSPEERKRASYDRSANSRIEEVLTAVEDAEELRAVERNVKRGKQKGGKTITLKSGNRVELPSRGKVSTGATMDLVGADVHQARLVDPLVLVEGWEGEARESARGRKGSHKTPRGKAEEEEEKGGATGEEPHGGEAQAGLAAAAGASTDASTGAAVAEEVAEERAGQSEDAGGGAAADEAGNTEEEGGQEEEGEAAAGRAGGEEAEGGGVRKSFLEVAGGATGGAMRAGRGVVEGAGELAEEDGAGAEEEEEAAEEEGEGAEERAAGDVDGDAGMAEEAEEEEEEEEAGEEGAVGGEDGGAGREGGKAAMAEREAETAKAVRGGAEAGLEGEGVRGTSGKDAGAGVREVGKAAKGGGAVQEGNAAEVEEESGARDDDRQEAEEEEEGEAGEEKGEASGQSANKTIQAAGASGEDVRMAEAEVEASSSAGEGKGREGAQGGRPVRRRERSPPTPKPTTAAQKLKHDLLAAMAAAKVPLEEIEDPEARAREEAWRKMEGELPATEVDTKCLARGSSDYCFKNWLKNGNSAQAPPGQHALPASMKAYQHAQAQMAALMQKRHEAAAAATAARHGKPQKG